MSNDPTLYPMQTKTFQYANQQYQIEYNHIALQSTASVIVRVGDCVIMANACHAATANEKFFPLTVNYSERFYSVGRIPGGFTRREGRPSDREVLICRIVDRTIRPMFADGFQDEVQVNIQLLQNDANVQPDTVAMLAASAALVLSGLPFTPIAGIRVGSKGGSLTFNPALAEQEDSDLDLIIGGSEDSIIMVESSAESMDEQSILAALAAGHTEMQSACRAIADLASSCDNSAEAWQASTTLDSCVEFWLEYLESKHASTIAQAHQHTAKKARNSALSNMRNQITDQALETIEARANEEHDKDQQLKALKIALAKLEKNWIRTQIIAKKPRLDGRNYDEVRPINIQTPFLPKTHGSALFTRGETQALVVVTLADEGSAQLIDGITPQSKERFMLHYNFPAFSVGECGPQLSPKRREIGHGYLARKAIARVLPSTSESFPYVLRIVSETLSSNGSSSMAAVCGSSLALMDAGVPVKSAVAGIAMGLVHDGDNFTVLSDILGDEDHHGDMDFKVAGTASGITALQMDIKTKGITSAILTTALEQAKKGRLHILEQMNHIISQPRSEFAETAPRVTQFKINPNKIREVIGRGGSTIKEIIETFEVTIDITDDGIVKIGSSNAEKANLARQRIEDIALDIEVGKTYDGKVVKIMDFGAFVNVLPGKDAFLHISQICHERVHDINEKLSEGQLVRVKVAEIDKQNRPKLTMKDIPQDG